MAILPIIEPVDVDRTTTLCIWTVYDKPSDFPTEYVARLHIVVGNAHAATTAHVRSENLDDVHETMLELGLTRMGRMEADEPQILETWI